MRRICQANHNCGAPPGRPPRWGLCANERLGPEDGAATGLQRRRTCALALGAPSPGGICTASISRKYRCRLDSYRSGDSAGGYSTWVSGFSADIRARKASRATSLAAGECDGADGEGRRAAGQSGARVPLGLRAAYASRLQC